VMLLGVSVLPAQHAAVQVSLFVWHLGVVERGILCIYSLRVGTLCCKTKLVGCCVHV